MAHLNLDADLKKITDPAQRQRLLFGLDPTTPKPSPETDTVWQTARSDDDFYVVPRQPVIEEEDIITFEEQASLDRILDGLPAFVGQVARDSQARVRRGFWGW